MAKAKAIYREACGYLGISARNAAAGPFPLTPPVLATITCYVRDRRRFDPDNLVASLKSGLDGLVDARLIKDDRATMFGIAPVKIVVSSKLRRRFIFIELKEMGDTNS